jgi:hypothetical protein
VVPRRGRSPRLHRDTRRRPREEASSERRPGNSSSGYDGGRFVRRPVVGGTGERDSGSPGRESFCFPPNPEYREGFIGLLSLSQGYSRRELKNRIGIGAWGQARARSSGICDGFFIFRAVSPSNLSKFSSLFVASGHFFFSPHAKPRAGHFGRPLLPDKQPPAMNLAQVRPRTMALSRRRILLLLRGGLRRGGTITVALNGVLHFVRHGQFVNDLLLAGIRLTKSLIALVPSSRPRRPFGVGSKLIILGRAPDRIEQTDGAARRSSHEQVRHEKDRSFCSGLSRRGHHCLRLVYSASFGFASRLEYPSAERRGYRLGRRTVRCPHRVVRAVLSG